MGMTPDPDFGAWLMADHVNYEMLAWNLILLFGDDDD
jgi:hypothetical protein